LIVSIEEKKYRYFVKRVLAKKNEMQVAHIYIRLN